MRVAKSVGGPGPLDGWAVQVHCVRAWRPPLSLVPDLQAAAEGLPGLTTAPVGLPADVKLPAAACALTGGGCCCAVLGDDGAGQFAGTGRLTHLP